MKKRVMVLWYLAVMTVSMSAQQITKVFHHQMPKDDLELGQIVFYFADQPIIKTLHSSGKKHELVYFFPDATLSPGAHAAAQALQETPLYKVTLKEVERPRGVKFIITFDTTKVMPPQYESFVAITRDKGLVFHLYNKELLHELELQHINKALLQVASHTAPRVVIDCGHGGDDCGAVGILANAQKVAEKDITMSVGLELAQQLRKHGIEVLLTRSDDVTVALDARTTFANKQTRPDLLISLHANWAANKQVSGIETFCLASNLFTPCTRDEALSPKIDALLHQRYKQSNQLAYCVHENLLAEVKKKYVDVVDRRVKRQVAQVLLGTQVYTPGILVELGFVSNQAELQRLMSYKKDFAQGMCKGIQQFLRQMC